MKIHTILALALFVSLSISTFSQTEKTIASVNEKDGKTEVEITGINIKVDEFSDTISTITLGHRRFQFIENHNNVKVRMTRIPWERFKGHYSGLEIGFNTLMTSDFSSTLPREMDLNNSKTINFSINFMQYNIGLQRHRKNVGLVTGMGITFSNYRFDSPYILTTDVNGKTISEETTREVKKNKLATTYINVPLLLELQVPGTHERQLFINAGAFCGLNIGSHTKVVYEDDNNKDKSRGNYNINPFQYGLTARMGYRFIKLFANYNLTPLFEKDMGPELYPFTVGLILCNF